MTALALADRWVNDFPAIDDVILRNLPKIELFGIGEIIFGLYIFCFAVLFFRQKNFDLPALLTALGIFYGLRGFFLLLLPIGPPIDAFGAAERLTIYPYASHAYFPGGHIGIMTIMALSLRDRRLKTAFIAAAALFGIGSMITRAHYSADLLGGIVLGYAVFVYLDRRRSRLNTQA